MPRIVVTPESVALDVRNVIPFVIDHKDLQGEYPTLHEKLRRITKVVALLAAELPPGRLVEIANATHFETFRMENEQ